MNRKLRIFGLAAFLFVLVAGIAWAFEPVTVTGTYRGDLTVLAEAEDPENVPEPAANLIEGNGMFTGSIIPAEGDPANADIVRINAARGNTLTIVPRAGKVISVFNPDESDELPEEADAGAMQLIVNDNGNMGTVYIRASNSDNPRRETNGVVYHTYYMGGTVLGSGILKITNTNSLGQGWVAAVGRKTEGLTVFGTDVDALKLGDGTDPWGTKVVQPFYLLWKQIGRADDDTHLRYVNIDVNSRSAAGARAGLEFGNGLAQLDIGLPRTGSDSDLATTDPSAQGIRVAPSGDTSTHYVQLVKTGPGNLRISGQTAGVDLAIDAIHEAVTTNIGDHKALDGALHRGGTWVKEGLLEVFADRATTSTNDHFRGSLGKTWATYRGSVSTYSGTNLLASFLLRAEDAGNNYNPLYVEKGGTVAVDRSQFFGEFGIKEGGTFEGLSYSINGVQCYPQIAVRLQGHDSAADGLLKGDFDLVLDSNWATTRPGNKPYDSAINMAAQAALFINNPTNEIGAKRETLISNGVLEIAGAKSIGGGTVTVGARGSIEGSAANINRGFHTSIAWTNRGLNLGNERWGCGVFAASKTFELPNVTRGQIGGALAAENGETLTFKDISLLNLGRTAYDAFRINPKGVVPEALRLTVANNPQFHGAWKGKATVAFGSADGKWNAAGTIRNPSRVDVEQGVWQLNNYPAATTLSKNTETFLHTYVWPEATLSLADGVRDFNTNKAHRMDLWVYDDSRIRMVLHNSDIKKSRAEAMASDPVFQAFTIDYTDLGMGQANRDRRVVLQLDTSKLSNANTIPVGWVKAVYSETAPNWNNLHFLRETSTVKYEDYIKVRVMWYRDSDLVELTKAEAYADENSNTILIYFPEAVTNPLQEPTTPSTPSTPNTPSTPTTPSTPSTPSTPTTPSTPSTPSTPASPATPDTVEPSDGGSSGGCEMGFGALSMALAAAAFLLRKKD